MIKHTPQNALRDYNIADLLLKESNLSYSKEKKEQIILIIDRLFENKHAKDYKNSNLYESILKKTCQKEFLLDNLIKHLCQNGGDIQRLQKTLSFIPTHLHNLEHPLIAVSSGKIEWLSEFEKVGYNLHVAKGSIVIPIWCSLLKTPERFHEIVEKHHLRPKNWINNLLEAAVSLGNSQSLHYLFEQKIYNPLVATEYAKLYKVSEHDILNTIEKLNILCEQKRLNESLEFNAQKNIETHVEQPLNSHPRIKI